MTLSLSLGHKQVPDGVASFEMDLDSYLPRNILKTYTNFFGLWDHHVNVPLVIVAVIADWVIVVVVWGLVNAVSIVGIGLKYI